MADKIVATLNGKGITQSEYDAKKKQWTQEDKLFWIKHFEKEIELKKKSLSKAEDGLKKAAGTSVEGMKKRFVQRLKNELSDLKARLAAEKKGTVTKPKAKRKVSQNSLNVLKALNKTADQLQRNAGTTEKIIKVPKLKRKDALKQAAKLYKK